MLVRNAKPRRSSPLRSDPTRTSTLRRQFCRDLSRRITLIKRNVIDLIVKEDAFSLLPENRMALNTRFKFNTTPQKVAAFQLWLADQFKHIVPSQESKTEDEWWDRYIEEGFRKGAGRAFDDTRPSVQAAMADDQGAVRDFYRGTKDEFLRSSFARPVSREKVELLSGRVFTELKGVTQDMSTKLTRSLTDGLVQGKSPRVIAKDIAKDVDGIESRRALVIARTEIVRAHAEGQLDALEAMGVEQVGVMVEWSTAEDERVCDECEAMGTTVVTVEEAHGMIPRHPNCRCAFIPANVGEDKDEQKRGKSAVDKAISASIRAEIPEGSKRTLAEQKERSSWGGADTRVSRARPVSILDEDEEE